MRAFALALCLCGVAAADPGKIYEVTFEGSPTLRLLHVTFFVDPPDRETVDRIVRGSVENAAMVDPNVEIMALAFDRDENALSDILVWDVKAQKVVRQDDR